MDEHSQKGKKSSGIDYAMIITILLVIQVILLGAVLYNVNLFTGLVVGDIQPSPQQGTAPQGGAAPQGQLSLEGARMLGNPDAEVVMVEYSSFTCPFCQRYHTETFNSIKENFVDSGDVLYVYKHFPRNDVDVTAANAAECAGEQGMFFEYSELVYKNQNMISQSAFVQWAQQLDLDVDEFNTCYDSQKFTQKITADRAEAQSWGIGGTPGFVVDGNVISGAQPYSVFQSAIQAGLN